MTGVPNRHHREHSLKRQRWANYQAARRVQIGTAVRTHRQGVGG